MNPRLANLAFVQRFIHFKANSPTKNDQIG